MTVPRMRAYVGVPYDEPTRTAREVLIDYLNEEYIAHATVIEARGMYKGAREDSLVVELIDLPEARENLIRACRKYNDKFDQESVLITEESITISYLLQEGVREI